MYSRPTCGLCDEARAVILAERQATDFRFEEVSIEGSEELEHEYGLRIPVIEVDEEEVFEFTVDPGSLRALLRR